MMLEVVLVFSPIFTLFISFLPKRTAKPNWKKDHGQSTKLVQGRWRRFWHSWVPIPTSVGVTVLAVLQWRRLQRERDQSESIVKEIQIACYRTLPLRIWSRTWGWITNCQIPMPLRPWVYKFYSKMTGANLEEMAGNLTDYPSLCQFFTRQLKEGVRPIDAADCIVSPADGTVLNSGQICSCDVDQVKGVTYKIQTFLGNPTWQHSNSSQNTDDDDDDSNSKFIKEVTNKRTDQNDNEVVRSKTIDNYTIPEAFWGGVDFVRYLSNVSQEQEKSVQDDWEQYKTQLVTNPNNVLYQVVVYLAPGDYHRFHSPVEWQVNFRRHFQGDLLSVNPIIAAWVPGLFTLNERVSYFGKWKHGFFSMTAVGATSVGSIKVYSDKTLHTNSYKWRNGIRHKDKVMNVTWNKGQDVGEFRLGSTIVLIFEAPKNYKFNLCSNQKVKVGEPLSGCKI